MLLFLAACFLPAFVISCAVTKFMRWVAPHWGLVDQPASRKMHAVPVPLGGGLGIYFGFVITVAVGHGLVWWLQRSGSSLTWLPGEIEAALPGLMLRTSQIWIIIGAGTLLCAAGLLDDLKPLPWPPRLALQLTVAMALVAGGVQATLFVEHPWIGWTVTVLWIVGLINSLNFLDNMDTLSGGIGLIASLLFSIVMLTHPSGPRWLVGGGLLVLSGSLTGFLVHNRSPARIFMGDSGSMFLGMMLASLTVLGTFYGPEASGRHVILAPLFVLSVPLYDTATVLWIRFREGRSPFQPDKSHFSHRLVALGLSPRAAVRCVHLATLTTGLGALLLYRVPDWTGALILATMVLCLLSIIRLLEMAAGSLSDQQELPKPFAVEDTEETSGGAS